MVKKRTDDMTDNFKNEMRVNRLTVAFRYSKDALENVREWKELQNTVSLTDLFDFNGDIHSYYLHWISYPWNYNMCMG